MTVELKPCPFCGGEAITVKMRAAGLRWRQVECIDCECGAVGPTAHDSEALAIAAWNTRPGEAALVAQLAEAREALANIRSKAFAVRAVKFSAADMARANERLDAVSAMAHAALAKPETPNAD